MLAATESVAAAAPITTLFNTHADGDHTWGNQLLGPEVEIVATSAAAEEMREVKPQMVQALRRIGPLASLIGKGPLPFPGRDQVRGLAEFSTQIHPFDFGAIELTYPTRTFDGKLTIDIGGREVRLIEVGPAHTLGDAMAWVPDTRTLFAADICFNGVLPIIWAGPVERWLAALERAKALKPDVVVPGHGPPAGPELLDELRAFWQWFVDAAPRHAERPLADAVLALAADEGFARFAHWDDPARLAVNLQVLRTGGTVRMSTGERLVALGAAAKVRRALG